MQVFRFLNGWILIYLCLNACAVDPLDDLDRASPKDSLVENQEAIHSWLWAFSPSTDSICVYHTIDQQCWEQFSIDIQPPWVHGAMIGGGIYPTLWTWQGNSVYGLTNGILDHGDHGHIVRPRQHVIFHEDSVQTIRALSASPDGKIIGVLEWNASTQTSRVIELNYLTGDTSTRLPSTDFQASFFALSSSKTLWVNPEGQMQIYDDSAQRLKTESLKGSPQSLTYANNKDVVLIASTQGLEMVDLETDSLYSPMAYPSSGQITSFLYAKQDKHKIGLWENATGSSDRVIKVTLDPYQMDAIILEGSSLARADQKEQYCLCENGAILFAADQLEKKLYRINLNDLSYTQQPLPHSIEALACNYTGTVVWVLSSDKARQVSFEHPVYVDSLNLLPGSRQIYLSSFEDNSSLFDSDDHTF